MENKMPPQLGCHEDEFDGQDKIYEEIMGARPPEMPNKYNAEQKNGRVTRMSQDSSLACVKFGISRYAETKERKENSKLTQLSPRFGYALGHLKNGGMTVRGGMKLWHKIGIPEESVFPTMRQGKKVTETWMRNKDDITDKVYKNAAIYKCKSYASIRSYKPEVIAQAIFENDGVVLGWKVPVASIGHLVYWSGFDLDNLTFDILDSYEPYDKKIIYKNGNFYKGATLIKLFSMWTAIDLPNYNNNMRTELVKLEDKPETFLVIGGKRYWIKTPEDFEALKAGDPITGISWKNVEKLKQFTTSYDGRIIGKPNFATLLKMLFGRIK